MPMRPLFAYLSHYPTGFTFLPVNVELLILQTGVITDPWSRALLKHSGQFY